MDVNSIGDFKGLALGASAFTIALAWNEAVSKTIASVYPQHKTGASVIYAIIITLLVVIIYAIAVYVGHYVKEAGGHVARFVKGL